MRADPASPEGKLLRAIRAYGMLEAHVAQNAGVGQNVLSRVKSGREMYASNLARLARAVGVDANWLFDGDPNTPVPPRGSTAPNLTDAQRQILAVAEVVGPERALARLVGLPDPAAPNGSGMDSGTGSGSGSKSGSGTGSGTGGSPLTVAPPPGRRSRSNDQAKGTG